jgi:hypothetical protein
MGRVQESGTLFSSFSRGESKRLTIPNPNHLAIIIFTAIFDPVSHLFSFGGSELLKLVNLLDIGRFYLLLFDYLHTKVRDRKTGIVVALSLMTQTPLRGSISRAERGG